MNAPRGGLGSSRFAGDGFFRSALESSPDCVKILDLSGRIQFVNRNGVVLMEAEDAASLLGVEWLSLWGEPERPMVAAALARGAEGETQRVMGPARTFRGALRYFDNAIAPLCDDAGAPVALLVTSRDVTEIEAARRAAEAREHEAELQAAILRSANEVARLGGWHGDFRTGLLTRSEECVRMMCGGPPVQPMRDGLDIYDPEDRPRIAAYMSRVRPPGERIRYEAPFTRYDGSRGWLRVFGEAVYEGDVCVGLRGAAMDISDEKAAEETIKRAEQRLILALQLAGMHVYELDFEQGLLTHHGSDDTLLDGDLTFDDLGSGLEMIVDPRDRDAVSAEWDAALANGVSFRSEFRVNRADGQEVWVFAVAETAFDETGRRRRLIGALKDITARKRSELQTLEAMARMREHETRQKLLLDELNHRVKNTLAAVQSVAVQTLRDEGDMAHARDLFIERLLALSSTHNLLVRRAWQSACLHELAETTLKPYGRPYEVIGADLQLDPNFAVSLGMALHELATNALKHGAWRGAGRVGIEVAQGAGGEVAITWRETGGGAVTPPTRRGFGSRLLERGVARELGGRVTLDFARSGLVCAIRVPESERLRVVHAQA
ncbi:MAG: PAS domain S-box protein [Phenylobacterium sp.]|uniref:PAS domain-containing protein n=1 Tax=Phenylobacterium sp. TaxID=1871053 RepID=UPI00121250F9|nr:PAS domain-containing protein [Phenylobacterium sp.]TAJ68456.1 MAG: PAS domain S-box protein [Phenylobacterium sp.]